MKTQEEKFEIFCNEIDRISKIGEEHQIEEYKRGMMAGIRHSKATAIIQLTDLPHDQKMKEIFGETKNTENGN